jgi:APA family basic amino acid/polyamine antiporter
LERREEKDYRILVPVVREDQKALVEFAALVARVEDAELQVSTVIELPSSVPLDSLGFKETAPAIKLVEKLKKASNRELVRSEGSVLVSHDATSSILDTVKEENINLLVLGWKGRTREGRFFGVTLDKLIQNADCDVVVFKSIGLKKEIKKILVVSAPEWHSSYATGYAVLFAKREEAEITIFSASQTEGALAKEKEYACKLAEICRTHGIVHQTKIIKADSLEKAIIQESGNYDLVVMGAALEWQQKRFAFGHVQDRVAKAMRTPILMVRKVKK